MGADASEDNKRNPRIKNRDTADLWLDDILFILVSVDFLANRLDAAMFPIL